MHGLARCRLPSMPTTPATLTILPTGDFAGALYPPAARARSPSAGPAKRRTVTQGVGARQFSGDVARARAGGRVRASPLGTRARTSSSTCSRVKSRWSPTRASNAWGAGQCARFPAGATNGHCLRNDGSQRCASWRWVAAIRGRGELPGRRPALPAGSLRPAGVHAQERWGRMGERS